MMQTKKYSNKQQGDFMKKIFLLLLSFIIANGFNGHQVSEAQEGEPKTENLSPTDQEQEKVPTRDYDTLIEYDQDRSSILANSRERYSGNTCEEEKNVQHQCVYDCHDIYKNQNFAQDCKKLPIAQIAVLAEIHEILGNPNVHKLLSIDTIDFAVYLNVSMSGFDNQINKYIPPQAREVVTWLIGTGELELVDLFFGQDRNFHSLDILFKRMVFDEYDSDADIYKPFTTTIDRNIDHGNRLMEVVVGTPAKLWQWFYDYIIYTNSDCKRNEFSGACFKVFCQIGVGIQPNFRSNWLRIEAFENYIEDIIELGVNGVSGASANSTNWNTDVLTVLDVDDFYTDLCKGCEADNATCTDGTL